MEEGAIEARGSETRTYTRARASTALYPRLPPFSHAYTRATPYLSLRAHYE